MQKSIDLKWKEIWSRCTVSLLKLTFIEKVISIPLNSLSGWSGSISPFPSSSSDPLFNEDFWSLFVSPIVFHQLAAIRKQSNVEVRDASYLLQFYISRSLDLQNTNCPNKFWKIIYSWKSVHILAKQCKCHFNFGQKFEILISRKFEIA